MSWFVSGMVKVKPGYQNVTELKGALKSSGSAVKGIQFLTLFTLIFRSLFFT